MSGGTHRLAYLLVYCALAAVTGCASLPAEVPIGAPAEIALPEVSFGVRTQTPDGQFELLPSNVIARRLQSRPGDAPLSILALSAGGAGGAFGAGAIVGLSHNDPRSAFSVVTGVSAGALVAPFAFLGPAWDPQVTAIFTQGESERLLQRRMLGALFGSSIYSGIPLSRLIERYVDDAMIEAVAAEALKGRLLLVATTDLATGDPVIWDLGSIALYGGQDAKPLFRLILLASASVPGMFPPVTIRFRAGGRMHEETHVDGAVTLPFFIAPTPEDLPQSSATMPTEVHVVIDSRLRGSPAYDAGTLHRHLQPWRLCRSEPHDEGDLGIDCRRRPSARNFTRLCGDTRILSAQKCLRLWFGCTALSFSVRLDLCRNGPPLDPQPAERRRTRRRATLHGNRHPMSCR